MNEKSMKKEKEDFLKRILSFEIVYISQKSKKGKEKIIIQIIWSKIQFLGENILICSGYIAIDEK
jgi:hypothetical protein